MLEDGSPIVARRVVLATGGGRANYPHWVQKIPSPYPQERLCHAQQVNLQGLNLAGERILIVGGGLSSGHLAVGAIARGAKVLLMARRELQEKLFDKEAIWQGHQWQIVCENGEKYECDRLWLATGTELFMMGGLAALQLGSTARNLAGGIRASRCIVGALVKPSLAVG